MVLLSKMMRDLGLIPNENPKWIQLDGDLDTLWIESMNSVMDMNKTLTLASNERIPLKPHMRMLFEMRDLAHASLATVTRAGVLYISDDGGHQWRAKTKQWIKSRREISAFKEAIQTCFDKYVEETILQIRKYLVHLVPISTMAMVSALLHLLECLLEDSYEKIDKDMTSAEILKTLEPKFVFSSVWAFGGAFDVKDGTDYRSMFSEWWKSNFRDVKFPARGLSLNSG